MAGEWQEDYGCDGVMQLHGSEVRECHVRAVF
jgi:hypothetical protein